MEKRILKITEELCAIPTAPYREQKVAAHVKAFAGKRGMHVKEDDFGNVVVTYGRQYKNVPFAFCAHMDHPGFLVTRTSQGPKTPALFYGGVEESFFRKGTKVRCFTAGGEVKGRVSSTSFNLKRRLQRVVLDFDGPVQRGDAAMWDLPRFSIRGDRIYSRSCDDTMGVAAVLALLDDLHRRRVKRKVLGVFSVAEETGMQGAKYIGMKRLVPKSARLVAIETSSVIPGVGIGDGVIVRVGDAMSIFDPGMTGFLTATARKLKGKNKAFMFQRKLMDGGYCEATLYRLAGYTCGAVCLALGNYHNRNRRTGRIAAEYVSAGDLVNMVALFCEIVQNKDHYRDFAAPARPCYDEERRGLGERLFRIKNKIYL